MILLAQKRAIQSQTSASEDISRLKPNDCHVCPRRERENFFLRAYGDFVRVGFAVTASGSGISELFGVATCSSGKDSR